MIVSLKALLHETESFALAAGLGLGLPTAENIEFLTSRGARLIDIDNRSVHLLPYIGGVYAPNDRLFAMGVLQFAFDTNGSPVSVNQTGRAGGELTRIGSLNDPTYMYLDVALGYWAYLNSAQSAHITGIAPLVELHWNRSLQDGDMVRSSNGFYQVGSNIGNIEVINMVLGANVLVDDDKRILVGYTTPISLIAYFCITIVHIKTGFIFNCQTRRIYAQSAVWPPSCA